MCDSGSVSVSEEESMPRTKAPSAVNGERSSKKRKERSWDSASESDGSSSSDEEGGGPSACGVNGVPLKRLQFLLFAQKCEASGIVDFAHAISKKEEGALELYKRGKLGRKRAIDDKKEKEKEQHDINPVALRHSAVLGSTTSAQVLVIQSGRWYDTNWFLIPRKELSQVDMEALAILCFRGSCYNMRKNEEWAEDLLFWRCDMGTIGEPTPPPTKDKRFLQRFRDGYGGNYNGDDSEWSRYEIEPEHVVGAKGPKTYVFFLNFTFEP